MMQNFSRGVKDYVFQDFGDEFEDESEQMSVEEALYHRFDLDLLEKLASISEGESEAVGEVSEESTPPPLAVLVQEAPDVDEILREAESRAGSIISEAMETAERIKAEALVEASEKINSAVQSGYDEGHEKGRIEGYEQALEESRRELEEKNRSLLDEISRAVAELENHKTEYIRRYSDEMKDLVIAIAEKVIKISLKSSSEVIRRMILSAVESSYQKQWARIYISDYDANLMVREDADILDALKNVSDKIKIVVMENGEPGDLMIEYPDQVVDAGVNTQLENIREIIENAR